MGLTDKTIASTFKDIIIISNGNVGFDTNIDQVKSGNGNGSALYLSTNNFKVQPSADSTTNSVIYDKDGNIESEYARDEFKKGPGYVKTKSKDKEVHIPYVWGDDPKPLDNIDEIRPYLVESPTRFEWFHKKDKPEDKYVTFLLSAPFFKRNKLNSKNKI